MKGDHYSREVRQGEEDKQSWKVQIGKARRDQGDCEYSCTYSRRFMKNS